jgi:hypothetical protein
MCVAARSLTKSDKERYTFIYNYQLLYFMPAASDCEFILEYFEYRVKC